MNHNKILSTTATRRDVIRGGTGIGMGLVAAGMSGLVDATAAYAHTAPEVGRLRQQFDFGWKFLRGDPQNAQDPAFNDSDWSDVDLPHDWSIEGPLSPSEPSGGPGGWVPTGVGWYRKVFAAPASRTAARTIIEFDGVYQNSTAGGVLNICGFKKPGFYFYQSQWTDEPMVYLFPHWNQNAQPGQIITVRCYTNCDSVELFLNGRSLGTKGYWHPAVGMINDFNNYPPERSTPRTTSDLSLAWDVPYEPGTLRAVGRKLNSVAVTTELSTTGAPAAIRLLVDREQIRADRRDVAHITAEIVDANGLVVPTANNRVMWSVEGAGTYVGSDNGNLSDRQDYRLTERNANQGRLLAIVRSTTVPGTVTVSATGSGLTGASVQFQTIAV